MRTFDRIRFVSFHKWAKYPLLQHMLHQHIFVELKSLRTVPHTWLSGTKQRQSHRGADEPSHHRPRRYHTTTSRFYSYTTIAACWSTAETLGGCFILPALWNHINVSAYQHDRDKSRFPPSQFPPSQVPTSNSTS